MAKYFKSIKSYDDLKNQYKKLLKANHPDNGGDLEAMKEINVEYDALFAVWKNKKPRQVKRSKKPQTAHEASSTLCLDGKEATTIGADH